MAKKNIVLSGKLILVLVSTLTIAEGLLWLFAVPNVYEQSENELNVYDEALGYRLRPNAVIIGKRTPYIEHPPIRISSQGFRDREFPVPKPSGVFRLCSLGDSFAFGWGVNTEECYAKCLESLLNKANQAAWYEVVNAGVPSYDSGTELIQLRQNLDEFAPNIVLCGVVDNDLLQPVVRIRGPNSYIPIWAKRQLRMSRLYTLFAAWYADGTDGVKYLLGWRKRTETAASVKLDIWTLVKGFTIEVDSALLVEHGRIDGFVADYVSMNTLMKGAFICVLLPNKYQTYTCDYTDKGFRRLEETLKQRGVHVINLVNLFRARYAEQLFLGDTHPSARGHELIADSIVAYLSGSGMLTTHIGN